MKLSLRLTVLTLLITSCGSEVEHSQIKIPTKDSISQKTINHVSNGFIGASEDPIVLRTDFSDDKEWEIICREIKTPDPELGFLAYVSFVNDTAFRGYQEKDLLEIRLQKYEHYFIFFVDEETIKNKEHPILCIGLHANSGLKFRTIPSEMWGVENNLSLSNMDFEEFVNAVDSDGVFRGFKDP